MPKQKRRGKSKTYHQTIDKTISGRASKIRWGSFPNNVVPKKFQNFVGDFITPDNLNRFKKVQYDFAIEQGYTEEEAENYVKFVVGKERKHYKAWLKGHPNYSYRGTIYKVETVADIEKRLSESGIKKINKA
jgi:hypothetical protein